MKSAVKEETASLASLMRETLKQVKHRKKRLKVTEPEIEMKNYFQRCSGCDRSDYCCWSMNEQRFLSTRLSMSLTKLGIMATVNQTLDKS